MARLLGLSYSPLTARILAVNMLAVIALGGSLVYLGRYQQQLIEAELESLAFEARIVANALAEGAVISGDDDRNLLAPELARSMVRRLVESSDSRTRLFDEDGALLADSRQLASRRKAIVIEPIQPLNEADWHNWWWRAMAWLGRQLNAANYETYAEPPEQMADSYPIALQALQGATQAQIWRVPQANLLLGVAVPVQAYKQVLGALLVTRPSQKIDAAIAEVRSDIIMVFCAVLSLTVLLSLYLARTIIRPLQRLAGAVRAVKQEQTQAVGLGGGAAALAKRDIPDLTARGDELGELSHALREMTAELATRLSATERFAADVAHELKNPLTSLRSAVETAERVTEPAKQQKLLQLIHDDVGRMDRLITDIASASRLDAELSRAATTPLDIGVMLQVLAGLYAPHDGAEDKAAVRLEVPTEKLLVSGVEERLLQVFRNLVDNARSFTPPGGSVRLAAQRDGVSVQVTVDDDGPGIPAGKLEAIFERFYSERPSAEKFGQHSGLGLSIARQIVAAHGGAIWAENRQDTTGKILGARFTVRLPTD